MHNTSSMNNTTTPGAEICFDNPRLQPVQWIGYPILLLLCTVGNVLCLYALYKYREKCSSTVYLVAVAICDLCVLWFYMGTFLVDIPNLPDNRTGNWIWSQYIESRGVVLWWRHTCMQLSDWTLIAFITERLILVYRSNKSKAIFIIMKEDTFRRAVTLVVILGVLCAGFQSCDLVRQSVYLARRHKFPTDTATDIVVGDFIQKWYDMQSSGEVVMTFLKWILITLLNCMLVYQMSRAQARRTLSFRHLSESSRGAFPNSVLLVSGVLYLLTQAPAAICEGFFQSTGVYYCYHFIPVINMLSLVNYSLNFFMYCLVTNKFRRFLSCSGIRSASLTSTRSNSSDTSKLSACSK